MSAPVRDDLKSTLNLPKTDFAMKANLPVNEPKTLARWDEMRLYYKIRESRAGKPIYVLHDGPPYANGLIHLGTALDKCLKDFVVKSKTMAGFDAPYVPGWDCHGLPIEIKVDESLGRKKLELDPLQVRQECRKYAEKYVDLQREQFRRLGVLGRWDDPYLTMSAQYESVIAQTFFQFLEKEFVYKGLKPVYWCIHDRTALAEAEVEYENHTSPSVWVKYALTSDPAKLDSALAGKKVNTIIWTTTPWTLPASMAVAFHPELEYVALESGGQVYIVADALAAATKEKCNLTDAREIARFKGRKLERSTFAHPFLDRSILGVLADYVTTDQGTGAVHTAPSHGADDFYTGAKYGLDQKVNVDEAGRIHNGLPEYDGKTVFKANEPIVELLKARGVLLGHEKIEHSYPHCWRCHNPVIFRATEQWFIAMDGKMEGGTLRSRALDEIKKVKWDPEWGELRISNMVETRPDWCISRQRIWGVPIAVFFCTDRKCNELLRSPEVNRKVVELFAKEGADSWYRHDAASILPAGTKCAKCGGKEFRKEMDIIDVWFESGSSHAAVLGHEKDLPWPADLYSEGGDQYRGWFQSSLLCAVGTRGKAPFREVTTHGWTLDPQGQAQHKSKGNAVDPDAIAKRLGGEIIRLWAASVEYREDSRSSEELMNRVAENYRKLRNTFRYVLGNLSDFDPAKNAVAFDQMEFVDQAMLVRTGDLNDEIAEWYEARLFNKVYHQANEFCVVDLSAIYFDLLKDRLYTAAPNSRGRRSAQTALWRIGETLVRAMAPLMSYTADEIWQMMPQLSARPESVHLSTFWKRNEVLGGEVGDDRGAVVRSEWAQLVATREAVMLALEPLRRDKVIGSGLEAQVELLASGNLFTTLQKHAAGLRELFIVSRVKLTRAEAANGDSPLEIRVAKADGTKCERCWTYSTEVGKDTEYPTVCERCSTALKEIAEGK
ncbi:MAG: isoleucine--tRNA ligase [Terriglobales bacterium]|jgi:isoleucyl-tRNA synthetase